MPTAPLVDFQSYFAEIEDPRVERTRRYELLDIIVIAVCAVICSADDWVDVEGWGNAKLDWLRQQGLPLLTGIPSHDTFGDVFGRLKPEQFETSFLRWVQAVMGASGGKIIATPALAAGASVDGKTLRRSHDRRLGKSAIHLVSAWASANHLLLGQVKVDAKSNEITAWFTRPAEWAENTFTICLPGGPWGNGNRPGIHQAELRPFAPRRLG